MQQEKIKRVNQLRNRISELRVSITRAEEALHNLVRSSFEKAFIESSKETETRIGPNKNRNGIQ